MKVAGAIIVIITAYILGTSRRGRMVEGEQVLRELIALLKELRAAVEHSADSLIDEIIRCAGKEAYQSLTFLQQAALGPLIVEQPGKALCNAMDSWDKLSMLKSDEYSTLREVFSEMGSHTAYGEITRLDFAVVQLESSLEDRHSFNDQRKGYYETIYTLVGVAAAIMLI